MPGGTPGSAAPSGPSPGAAAALAARVRWRNVELDAIAVGYWNQLSQAEMGALYTKLCWGETVPMPPEVVQMLQDAFPDNFSGNDGCRAVLLTDPRKWMAQLKAWCAQVGCPVRHQQKSFTTDEMEWLVSPGALGPGSNAERRRNTAIKRHQEWQGLEYPAVKQEFIEKFGYVRGPAWTEVNVVDAVREAHRKAMEQDQGLQPLPRRGAATRKAARRAQEEEQAKEDRRTAAGVRQVQRAEEQRVQEAAAREDAEYAKYMPCREAMDEVRTELAALIGDVPTRMTEERVQRAEELFGKLETARKKVVHYSKFADRDPSQVQSLQATVKTLGEAAAVYASTPDGTWARQWNKPSTAAGFAVPTAAPVPAKKRKLGKAKDHKRGGPRRLQFLRGEGDQHPAAPCGAYPFAEAGVQRPPVRAGAAAAAAGRDAAHLRHGRRHAGARPGPGAGPHHDQGAAG